MTEKRYLVLRFPNDVTRNAALAVLKREMPRVPFEDLSSVGDAFQRIQAEMSRLPILSEGETLGEELDRTPADIDVPIAFDGDGDGS